MLHLKNNTTFATRLRLLSVKILSFLLLCFFFAGAQADCDFTLAGQVLDEHDGQPLAFAFIVIEGSNKATTSDSLGFYKIEGLCQQKIIVHCDHMGCERIIDTLTITENTVHNFYPEHHINELGVLEIVTKAKLPKNKNAQELSEDDKTQMQSLQLGEALSTLSGVQNQSSGGNVSKPAIHGMHSNRVLILNNEIRQEGQQWGTDHGVELDFTNTEHVRVITGANSLAYGSDAIGGVILLDRAPLRVKHGVDGNVFLGAESNGQRGVAAAEFNGNFKAVPQLSYRVQGSLKKAGNASAPNYYLDNTGFEEQSYSWALGYRASNYGVEFDYSDFNSDFGVFSGAHIGNLTDLRTAFESSKPLTANEFTYAIARPFQRVSHETVKVKSFLYVNDSTKLELIYGRQFNRREEYDNHSNANTPDFRFNLTTHSAEFKYHTSLKNRETRSGFQGQYQVNTWDGRFFIPNYEKYSAGAYWIETFTKGPHIFDLGARADAVLLKVYFVENDVLQTPERQFLNVNGNVGYTYSKNDNFLFRTNIGTAWRPPSVNELYSDGLHHGSAALEYGDASLQQEQVVNWNATAEKKMKKLNISATAYFNFFSNYLYLAPTGNTLLTIRGAFPVFEFEAIQAQIHGADVDASYDFLKALSVTARANVLRGINQTEGKFLWGMPSDEYTGKIVWKPLLGKRLSKKLSDTKFDLAVQHVTQQIRFHEEDDFVAPPSEYTLLNASFFTKLSAKTPITFHFGVRNILNTSFRSYLNRFRYFADEAGRNFTIGIKYNFEINENHHHHK